MMFVLRVRYPMSGSIQDREYAHLDEAVRAAHQHFSSFPDGLAIIHKPDSKEVVMEHRELLLTFRKPR